MVTTPHLVGGALGLGVQIVSNLVRKYPAHRHPWEHVLAIGIGAYAGQEYMKFRDKNRLQHEELIARRKAMENAPEAAAMRRPNMHYEKH